MAQQRKALWESDLDEDLHDVDLSLAIGTYGQNGLYDDGKISAHPANNLAYVYLAQPRIDEATLLAVQQQVAQQAALAQVPDAVKRVRLLPDVPLNAKLSTVHRTFSSIGLGQQPSRNQCRI